jgi:hypothetical protein
MLSDPAISQHLLIFAAMVVALGGVVLGILRGWRAIIDQMKEIVLDHEEREKVWSDENERHASEFRSEVLDRLERVEGDVQSIREHLIAKGHLPVRDDE